MPAHARPIQRTLMMVILLTCGAVMLITSGAFFAYEYLTFRQLTLRNLEILGEAIAANSTAALAFDNPDDAREALSAFKDVALPAPPKPKLEKQKDTQRKSGGEVIEGNVVRMEGLVSSRALEQVSAIAPQWDKYILEVTYKEWVAGLGEMPRDADAAFLGWVRKFTKGKPP